MKVVVADTGALISLAIVGQIDLIEKIFDNFYIAKAVWDELLKHKHLLTDKNLIKRFEKHIIQIKSANYLSVLMDYGESESVILYDEMKADFLLIDDNRARKIAESLNVNCIGSIGLLIKGKEKGIVKQLRPCFEKLIQSGRYFSEKLLNQILEKYGEEQI